MCRRRMCRTHNCPPSPQFTTSQFSDISTGTPIRSPYLQDSQYPFLSEDELREEVSSIFRAALQQPPNNVAATDDEPIGFTFTAKNPALMPRTPIKKEATSPYQPRSPGNGTSNAGMTPPLAPESTTPTPNNSPKTPSARQVRRENERRGKCTYFITTRFHTACLPCPI